MAISVTLSDSALKAIGGSYVLTHGITPSILTVQVIPGTGDFSLFHDVTFSDGEREQVFRDCRLLSVGGGLDPTYGSIWNIKLQDHRWKWAYGQISGTHEAESAYELAVILFLEMEEYDVDIDILPQDEGPVVEWDFTNPAEALANICDRYGCLICYDPDTHRVSLRPKGEGDSLPTDWPYDVFEYTVSNPHIPEELVGVCEYTEHEVDLELEAVGLENDGTIIEIDLLSYKPEDGWGADYITFHNVLDDDDRARAEQSIYRWYRIKGGQSVDGLDGEPSLSELVPISGRRIAEATQTASDETEEVVRKPAYVYGIFALDTGLPENSEEETKHSDPFQIDEKTGIVKFSRPVFAYELEVEDHVTVITPTLFLRCTVFSERYTRSRTLTGAYGSFPVPCAGITRKIVATNSVEEESASDNVGEVDDAVDVILDEFSKRFDLVDVGRAHYIGIWPAKLDGKIQQVSWDVAKAGAFTAASENSEQDLRAPLAAERRSIEKQRTPVTTGFASQEKLAATPEKKGDSPAPLIREPRWILAYNNENEIVPPYSFVWVTDYIIQTDRTTPAMRFIQPGGIDQADYWVSGPIEIPPYTYGLISRDFPLLVHREEGAAFGVGAHCGPGVDVWGAITDSYGFVCVAAINDQWQGQWLAEIAPGPPRTVDEYPEHEH